MLRAAQKPDVCLEAVVECFVAIRHACRTITLGMSWQRNLFSRPVEKVRLLKAKYHRVSYQVIMFS